MQNYKLVDGQQGEKVLVINDIHSVCPFVPAIIMKGQVGQMQIMRMPCTTLCPLVILENVQVSANGEPVKEMLVYETICGSRSCRHTIEITEAEPKKGGTILSMV